MSKKKLMKIIEDVFKEYPNSRWKAKFDKHFPQRYAEITIQFNLEEEE